jgi:hypothetical protein
MGFANDLQVSRIGIGSIWYLDGELIEIEENACGDEDLPPLKGLSFLDRFLVVWIILAMAIGILLGNLVPSTGPALRKGEFIGVSIPIGTFDPLGIVDTSLLTLDSGWPARHDVPDPLQGAVRKVASPRQVQRPLDTDPSVIYLELDHCTPLHGRPGLGISTRSARPS